MRYLRHSQNKYKQVSPANGVRGASKIFPPIIKYGMKIRIKRVAAIALPVFFTLALAITIICCSVSSCAGALDFSAEFFYVCYKSPTNSQSAASVSGVVHSYGGAGYIVENDGKYYVTVSCYYNKNDADAVCATLNNKGLSCMVINAQANKITLPSSAKKNAESHKGTLNTLYSISVMCYDLANAMDGGTTNQSAAKSILSEIGTGLESLHRANSNNCFTEELSYLIAECEDVSHGYVLAYDVRRLQIAITDSIIHIRLY